jgi:hypothetical protein
MSVKKPILIAVVVCLFVATVALAAVHFISCSKSAQGNNLVVSFKEAGLGNDVTCIEITADASANYACYNGGGKNPSAANKRTVSAHLVETGCFTPHNGQITGSLTLTPPGPGDFSCPPGQRLRLDSVSYTNVLVRDTTHNKTCTP